MVSILAAALAVVLGLAFGAVFGVSGARKGWRGAVVNAGLVAVAVAVAYFFAPVLAREIAVGHGVSDAKILALDFAAGFNADGLAFTKILNDTAVRLVTVPASCAVFFMTLVLLHAMLSVVNTALNRPRAALAPRQKATGAAIGVLTAAALCTFALFVPKIKIINEARNIDTVIENAARVAKNPLAAVNILHVCLETEIIAADADLRSEAVLLPITRLLNESGDPLFVSLAARLDYPNGDDFIKDAQTAALLAETMNVDDLSPDGLLTAAKSIADPALFAERLYSLRCADALIRIALSYAVRGISGDGGYIFPTDCPTSGTQAAFAELLAALPSFESGGADAAKTLNRLKHSPLLPPEVFAKLKFSRNTQE